MTRTEYIAHLNDLHLDFSRLIKKNADFINDCGSLRDATELEVERSKKTTKMMHDFATRLYEDSAISMRIRKEKLAAGEFEQSEMDFGSTQEDDDE